jgi:hypothetical protein
VKVKIEVNRKDHLETLGDRVEVVTARQLVERYAGR